MSNELMTLEKYFTERQDKLATILPKHLTAERVVRIVLAAASRTPKLLQCTPESIYLACHTASQLGLEPGGPLGHAYLVPYWNNKIGKMECQYQPGYRGLVELARRSGEITTIAARIVHAGDKFEYYEDERGVHFKFVPGVGERGKITGAFAYAILKDGGCQFEPMTYDELCAIRDRSKSRDKEGNVTGPWATDFGEMARKTPLKRLCKMLPASIQLADAITQDDVVSGHTEIEGTATVVAKPAAQSLSDAPAPASSPERQASVEAAKAHLRARLGTPAETPATPPVVPTAPAAEAAPATPAVPESPPAEPPPRKPRAKKTTPTAPTEAPATQASPPTPTAPEPTLNPVAPPVGDGPSVPTETKAVNVATVKQWITNSSKLYIVTAVDGEDYRTHNLVIASFCRRFKDKPEMVALTFTVESGEKCATCLDGIERWIETAEAAPEPIEEAEESQDLEPSVQETTASPAEEAGLDEAVQHCTEVLTFLGVSEGAAIHGKPAFLATDSKQRKYSTTNAKLASAVNSQKGKPVTTNYSIVQGERCLVSIAPTEEPKPTKKKAEPKPAAPKTEPAKPETPTAEPARKIEQTTVMIEGKINKVEAGGKRTWWIYDATATKYSSDDDEVAKLAAEMRDKKVKVNISYYDEGGVYVITNLEAAPAEAAPAEAGPQEL